MRTWAFLSPDPENILGGSAGDSLSGLMMGKAGAVHVGFTVVRL